VNLPVSCFGSETAATDDLVRLSVKLNCRRDDGRDARIAGRRASWSSRIAVPSGYGSSYESFASFTARAGAIGGAPIGKSLWIDVDAHHDVAVGFETGLHFFGHSLPLLPVARHFGSIRENFQNRQVIFLVDSIDSNRGRLLIF
jgi:hypothetical protein